MSEKRKIELTLWETVKYSRTAVIEIDENMSESDFNFILNGAERNSHPDDVIYELETNGVKVLESFNNDYSSPIDSELEIVDYVEVRENE